MLERMLEWDMEGEFLVVRNALGFWVELVEWEGFRWEMG